MTSNINKKFSYTLLNKQKGFSLLELLVVIGILGLSSGFIYPEIGKWKIKRNIEKDYQTITSTIDYLKTRARTVNGTSVIHCSFSGGLYSIRYEISSQRNDASGAGAEWTKHPNFDANIIERSDGDSLVTGKVSTPCNQNTTIFNASGNAGSIGTGAALEVEVNYQVSGVPDYVNFNAYKVKVNTATAFVQKYKYNLTTEVWVELN